MEILSFSIGIKTFDPNSKKLIRNFKLPLFFFLIASIAGVILRLINIGVLPFLKFKYLLHTHSHIALLGWAYLQLIYSLIPQFLGEKCLRQKNYVLLFWAKIISVIGMLLSFPFQGYGLYSIIFSTLFLITTYWFSFIFWKDLKRLKKIDYSIKFIFSGLVYLVLSSLGPWALGPLMAKGLQGTIWYKMAIYFYLHFLYNGFFVFTFFGLILNYLKKVGFGIGDRSEMVLFRIMQFTCIPSFLLSYLWTFPSDYIFLFSFLISVVQFMAVFYVYPITVNLFKIQKNKNTSFFIGVLIGVFSISFILKLLLQVVSSFGLFVRLILQFKSYFVIGYLHLVFLGFITCFLFWFSFTKGQLKIENNNTKIGLGMFLLGTIISEVLLFYKGFLGWFKLDGFEDFGFFIVGISLIIPLGLAFILFGQFGTSKNLKLNP